MLVAASLPSQESVEHARRQWRSLGSESFGRTLRSKKPPSGGSLCLALYADSITAAEAGAQAGCDIVYFEPEYFGSKNRCGIPEDSLTIPEQIDQAAGICREAHVRFAVKLPRITRDDYLGEVLPHIRKAADPFTKEYMVENIGTARALIGTVPSLALDGSSGLNVFNFEAVRTLSTHFRMLTLSCELSREQIRILTKTARSEGISTVFGLIVQGTNEAVISEDCLAEPFLRCAGIPRRNPDAEFFGIRDETGRVFPVRIDGECRSRIGNAQELCLIDHLPSLLRIGIGEVAVDARGRTGDYAEEMTRIYREAVGMVNNGAKTGDRRLTAAKERARRMALGGITAGHFLRGLKEP
jgi:putative protease